MNNGKIIIAILSIITIILTSCGDKTVEAKMASLEKLKSEQAALTTKIKALEDEIKSSGAKIESREKIINVAISTIETSKYNHFITVQGRVDGDENATISAKVPGLVLNVLVKPGSVVKAGQVLAEFDGNAIRKQIQPLETNLVFLTDLYNKQKALWDKQIGSEIQYKQAKTNKEALEQNIAAMREQLSMYKITATVNGTIDVVNLKVGQMAMPGLPCFTIINFNKLKVKADVAETFANKIKEGNLVQVEFPDIEKTITSKITYSGKGISALNRTFGVEVALPSDNSYLPNMIAVLKIIDYSKENAIVIPVNCIQNSQEGTNVYVAVTENGKTIAKKHLVKVGSTYNDKAEILSGLEIGEKLITVGYGDLNDGELIKF
ncbi:MAG: efflux RND transporter periplasmic adaptor subunit [Bacteroidia bacterium]|nr:efflux RND transporter periplasmic adaptor subunit [Bacteroidia bacterium]